MVACTHQPLGTAFTGSQTVVAMNSKPEDGAGLSGNSPSDREALAAYLRIGKWSSIPEYIAAYLRGKRRYESGPREVAQQESAAPANKRSKLRLTEEELSEIRSEALDRFIGAMNLSEELRAGQQSLQQRFRKNFEQLRKYPARELGERGLLAALFARHYEEQVRMAAGDFADMLTQAVIARQGRKDFPLQLRTEIWKECLELAMQLARWESASLWIFFACVPGPQERRLLHEDKLDDRLDDPAKQRAAAENFTEKFRPEFEESIKYGLPQWLGEVERRMSLRCLLTYVPPRRAIPDDPSKKAVAMILITTPQLTTKQQCAPSWTPRTSEVTAQRRFPPIGRKAGRARGPDAYDHTLSRTGGPIHQQNQKNARAVVLTGHSRNLAHNHCRINKPSSPSFWH